MKKIVCIALAASFLVALFTFSSSAANITQTVPINRIGIYLRRGSSFYGFVENDGVFTAYFPNDVAQGFSYNSIEFDMYETFEVVPPSGKGVSLGLTVDFKVLYDGSIAEADARIDNILDAVIWRGCFLRVYNSSMSYPLQVEPYSFILRDVDSGEIVEVTEEFIYYWETFASSSQHLQLVALFDFSSLIGSTITHFALFIPGGSNYNIYSFPGALAYQISDFSASYNFVYTPFENVVQDDLTDIKGQLGTLNSTMNTIDQDVNRVNQSVTDLKDTIEDFQQDLTSSDSSISSDISDKQDIIDSIQDAMQNDNALLDDNLNDMITGFPGAQDPFHNAPSPDGFFAVDFIQQLWSFIKAQTIFFDFIFLGLCFCLATFILRR